MVAVAPFSEHVYVSPSTDGVALQLYTTSSPLTMALPLRLTATGGEVIGGEVIAGEMVVRKCGYRYIESEAILDCLPDYSM